MRAGVLSENKIIEFLNNNFINTWVPNSELGRIQSLREPIAKRREREGKNFDTSHPLAQAIIKGWKTGSKKGSPVDCFVISSEFELTGRQLVNELRDDSEKKGLSISEYYLTFLKEALAGKQPGFGNLVFTPEHPSQTVLDIFRTPIDGHHDYTIVVIDVSDFEKGGTLTIDIEVGRGNGDGTFYLVNGDTEFPTIAGIPQKDLLAWAWSESGETGQITHHFDRGQLFKLGVTGAWARDEPCVNAFRAKISVKPAEKPELM